jgi:hypothetical protein|tara:strand:- start:546 stop:668 length:123 start_codon:yes stop_codon:yes gene_type:complete
MLKPFKSKDRKDLSTKVIVASLSFLLGTLIGKAIIFLSHI